LHGLVHWLAGAYAKKGITVNGVAPALIEETKLLPGASTELSASKSYIVRGRSCRLKTDEHPGIPIGRLGKPDEVAETVVWMVKNGYIHNKVIAVDGGAYIQ
jgi:3-oxoacyl-[acyl-carrier protein] reductase